MKTAKIYEIIMMRNATAGPQNARRVSAVATELSGWERFSPPRQKRVNVFSFQPP